jgi:hypothetical protein
MAKKPDNEGFLQLNPDVAAFINRGADRQDTARLPKNLRKAKARDKEKQEHRKGARACYDLSPELIKAVSDYANELGVTSSQVAAFALMHFILDARGQIDIQKYLTKIENPRYSHRLDYPQ